MKRLFGIFLFIQLVLAGSAYALPSIDPQYSPEYDKIRNERHTKSLDILEDAAKYDNDFLRELRHPQPTSIELMLTDAESGYGFFSPDSSRKELEELIEYTQDPKNRMTSAEKELVLGDAYHWLGHIYEEKGQMSEAFECYVRSHVHYQKTPLQTSPRINPNLIVQEHGKDHLKNIVSTIETWASMPAFKVEVCASLFR